MDVGSGGTDEERGGGVGGSVGRVGAAEDCGCEAEEEASVCGLVGAAEDCAKEELKGTRLVVGSPDPLS